MQKQTELRTGDIVHLNSGSPNLKVAAVGDGWVEVEWSGENGRMERMKAPGVCFHRA